jgi:hypothetical protein
MIYFPAILARPWPQVLSSAPVSWIQDIAGVSPLLFLNVLPAYRPGIHVALLNVWFVVTILYFIAGLFILAAAWHRIANANERHRVGALCFAVLFFGAVAVQNVFERNWGNWFGSPLPRLLSAPVSVSMDFLFPLVPLTFVYYVLTENGQAAESSTRDAST